MIQKILAVIISCMPLWIQGQVTLSAQLPPAGLIQKDQLWNLVLVNNSSSSVEVSIFLNLQDVVTGEPVLSAGTRSILLTRGAKVLNVQDVQPVQYNYGVSGLAGQFLPLGTYIACYTLTRDGAKGTETLAEECIRVNILPLSPPLLNTPANGAVIPAFNPQFTWTPPAPVTMFSDLNYDISVAEMTEGQTASEAILYNPPLYVKSNTRFAQEIYPSSYARLEPGKTYAWQVTAKNGFNYSIPTEAWSFTIAGDSAQRQESSTSYLLLKRNTDAGIHYITGNVLLVKYYSYDDTHTGTIRFYDGNRKLLQEKNQPLRYGDNFLQFTLNHLYRKGAVYYIEITGKQHKIYSTGFIIK